jgi:hypothetical protein
VLEPALSDRVRGEPERGERRVDVALGEAEKGRPRLRIEADLAGASEALLGTGEVADPSTYLAVS